MRIKIINPDYGLTQEQLRHREKKLSEVCRHDTTLEMECVQLTEVFVDSQKDIVVVGRELMEIAVRAEKEGFDAVVIYCGSDPAIAAIREMVRIPVVGGGMASFAYANTLGYSFSMLVTNLNRIPEKRQFVASLGYAPGRLLSVRAVSLSDLEIQVDRERTMELLLSEIEECVREDQAEVIVLGCLSFLGYARELSRMSGIPVIDPGQVSVLLAESLVAMGLSHSRISYPLPPVAELPHITDSNT